MFQPRSIQSSMSFRDKVVSMDFVLILSILLQNFIFCNVTLGLPNYSTSSRDFSNFFTKSIT